MLDKIDSTNLKPMATEADIRKLCLEAIRYKFRGVCVHPKWVSYADSVLGDNMVELVTVIGFPLGCNTIDIKLKEAAQACFNGATEVDMVWNQSSFRDGHYLRVIEEIIRIRDCIPDLRVKVIVEVAHILEKDLDIALSVVADSGAYCIKTSTGTAEDLDLIPVVKRWKRLGSGLKIKAAGGIHESEYVEGLLEAGADILGTSSGAHFARYCLGSERAFPEDMTSL